jgi:adenylylsulfate reductase subunit A
LKPTAFEEWGLPLMKDPKRADLPEGELGKGAYMREGRWQIMIHGESYKPIVAEAAKVNADKTFNRIMVTHLLMDDAQDNRVAGAVGFNVRTGNYHVFKSKTVVVGAGGASNIFKPRSVGWTITVFKSSQNDTIFHLRHLRTCFN